jgi:hypothetical protein
MRNIDEEIDEFKKELVDKYNIKTDRDLIKQLGIKPEDKEKFFLWLNLYGAYEYRAGCKEGVEDLQYKLKELLDIN